MSFFINPFGGSRFKRLVTPPVVEEPAERKEIGYKTIKSDPAERKEIGYKTIKSDPAVTRGGLPEAVADLFANDGAFREDVVSLGLGGSLPLLLAVAVGAYLLLSRK